MHRRERVYRREMGRRGAPPGHGSRPLPEGASVGANTRLQPKEASGRALHRALSRELERIVARLEYHDASDPKAGTKTTRHRGAATARERMRAGGRRHSGRTVCAIRPHPRDSCAQIPRPDGRFEPFLAAPRLQHPHASGRPHRPGVEAPCQIERAGGDSQADGRHVRPVGERAWSGHRPGRAGMSRRDGRCPSAWWA